MSRRTAVVAVAVGAVVVLASHSRADACSPPAPLEQPRVLPANGSVDVPTNARVAVVWDGTQARNLCGQEVTVWLRPVDSPNVSLVRERRDEPSRTVVIAVPEAPLLPSTQYEILLNPLPTPPLTCAPATPAVVATFVTGDAADVTAPVFAGLEPATPYADICDLDCSCDLDWGRLLVDLVWSSATDETPAGALRYNVYRTDGDAPLLSLVQWATLSRLCWGNDAENSGAGFVRTTDGSFYVRAVDLAGNEDDNVATVDVVFDCAALAPEIDAGPAAGADAGPGDGTHSGGCGCRAGGAGDAAGAAWTAVVLLCWCLRRRRARRAVVG